MKIEDGFVCELLLCIGRTEKGDGIENVDCVLHTI